MHPHFYLDGDDALVDVAECLAFTGIPEALPGHEIARLDGGLRSARKFSAAWICGSIAAHDCVFVVSSKNQSRLRQKSMVRESFKPVRNAW